MKLFAALTAAVRAGSPPSRGVWIETFMKMPFVPIKRVAPLAGGVD